jgi:hypothetical protein
MYKFYGKIAKTFEGSTWISNGSVGLGGFLPVVIFVTYISKQLCMHAVSRNTAMSECRPSAHLMRWVCHTFVAPSCKNWDQWTRFLFQANYSPTGPAYVHSGENTTPYPSLTRTLASFSLRNISRTCTAIYMRWAEHVARMGEGRGVHRVLVGKPEGKRPLGRPRRRW